MITVSVLFGTMALFSVFQLFKVINFQENNFLFLNNVSTLSDLINKYPAQAMYTDEIIDKLQELKIRVEACNAIMNRLDKTFIKMLVDGKGIESCQEDLVVIEELMTRLQDHNQLQHDETINNNPYLIYEITAAIKDFAEHSQALEKLSKVINQTTINLVRGVFLPFCMILMGFSAFILNRIGNKTRELYAAVEALEISKEEQEKLAYYDSVTTLPNRNMFNEILGQETLKATRYNKSFAILSIDLDRFKYVNDTYGHDAGDDLLIQASGRFKQCVRESDFVARFGGDEFQIILPEISNQQDAANVANKICIEIAKPFMLGEYEVSISASIGIARCPDDAVERDTLLKCADLALYTAKENGKSGYHIYDDTGSKQNVIQLNCATKK